MPSEFVLDASVAAKVFFFEEGSEAARACVSSGDFVCAPDLLFIELASVAAKRVRQGISSDDRALGALRSVGSIVDLVAPSRDHSERAYALARDHGFSVYDSVYLALAEERAIPVVTADERLLRRAESAGMGARVRRL
jgi:predicted nucleic acid-binding protein